MKNNRLLYLILIIAVISLIVFNNLNFFSSKGNDEKKEDKNIEKFHYGYHGSHGGYLPFTTSYTPETNSQQKQYKTNPYKYISKYTSPYFYPNLILPATTIGCGGRRGACMGGSQIPVPNTIPPVDISEQNIAPVNIGVRGYDDGLQQVGTIQKVFGNDNIVYPLYGRRIYRYDNKWEYFTKFGPYGVTLPVLPLRNYEEFNTNDRVFIQGQKDEYRVTIYDRYVPQYLPVF